MQHQKTNPHNISYHVKAGLVSAIVFTLTACSSDGGNSSVSGEPNSPPAESEDALTQEVPGEASTTAIGDVLVFGTARRTLYTFGNDTQGVSNCNGGCAVTWPPIVSDTEVTGELFSTVERDDASQQWALKDKPLYYYVGDASEGEFNGEGLGDVWFVARPDPFSTGETNLGTVLTGSGSIYSGQGSAAERVERDGMTLYMFANDTPNTSNCDGECAVVWPPLFADKGAVAHGGYTLLDRSDGSTQWAYQSQPLYFYVGDSDVGDTSGEGVGGVWSVAKP